MNFEDKINELKIKLPKAADPVGSYVAAKISNKMLFISGQISINEKGELIKGKPGKDLDTEAGYNAAKRCALSIIAQVKKACNDDLSKVKSCIKPPYCGTRPNLNFVKRSLIGSFVDFVPSINISP